MFQLPKHRTSPWHAGEKAIQERVGVADRMEVHGQKVIRDYMPDQHREFYQQLPFIIVGAVDQQGRPWATLLEGAEGFITSPTRKACCWTAWPTIRTPPPAACRPVAPSACWASSCTPGGATA